MREKDLAILRWIIDIFVRDGTPVSSRRLKEASGIRDSTATIRNAMARLERAGYIGKPHASAGRVPTDVGYRAFVDRLESDSTYGEVFSRRLRMELSDLSMGIHHVMAVTSRILGGLSRGVALVYGSVVDESRVSRIRLITLEGDRLLVVVNLLPEYERTAVIRLERRFPVDVIASVESRINRAVQNKTLSEAKEALDAVIRDNITDEGIVAREVAIHREDIFSDPPAVEFYFEERDHLFAQPELSDPKLMQLLLRLLNDREYLMALLSDRLSPETQITIGKEHRDEDLQPFSVVTAGYRMGTTRGVLGIIGPTRMQYGFVRALVGTAARELEAIGEEYF